jgi:dolichol-phosphate mannosyltransferase
VHTGTSSEYGYKDHPPSESEALEPNSHYAVTKASSTMFCTLTARNAGASISTLRLYSVYGPWEEPSRLIPSIVVEGLQGRLPPLVHPGIGRDFVHVDDVCEAYVTAASAARPGQGAVYNVGSGRQTTIGEVVDLARARFGIEAEPQWGSMPERSWDTTVWVSDPTRIRTELGWAPKVGLADGLDRLIAWFEADPARIDLYRRLRAAGG